MKWHDISKIDEFREYYQYNNYVVLVQEVNEDDEVFFSVDIAFGISLFPENVVRFFCVPEDEESPEILKLQDQGHNMDIKDKL